MDPEKPLQSGLGMMVAGMAGLLLAPIVLPALALVARPAAKTAVRAGLIMAARGRETLAELTEMAEDMVAEVQAELKAEHEAALATAAPTRPAEAAE